MTSLSSSRTLSRCCVGHAIPLRQSLQCFCRMIAYMSRKNAILGIWCKCVACRTESIFLPSGGTQPTNAWPGKMPLLYLWRHLWQSSGRRSFTSITRWPTIARNSFWSCSGSLVCPWRPVSLNWRRRTLC
ncbi:hypothetical protein AHAS_Ahas06G0123100 [Arachis hypogaea]